jgi:tetratricopeptide (TPR) repeat protein
MMLQDDYLMRMIRLATTVFAHIIGLKQIASYQDALAIIDQAIEMIFGMNPALINNLDDDSLINLLTTPDGLEVDKLLILAGLFKERGDIYAAIDQPGESRTFYYRAINFYLDLFFDPAHIPIEVLVDKIEEILRVLAAQTLSDELVYRLFFYYEQTQQFSAATRALENLIDSTGIDPELTSRARVFYQRLLAMGDEELAAGAISREEIRSLLKRITG